jgi:hypothetical protein
VLVEYFNSQNIPAELVEHRGLYSKASYATSSKLWLGFYEDFPLDVLPRKFILYNGEPLAAEKWRNRSDLQGVLPHLLEFWGFTEECEKVVSPSGVSVRYVPFGYADQLINPHLKDRKGPNVNEDIDLLFYGTVTPRRKPLLNRLRDAGFKLKVLEWPRDQYGKDLDATLRRSKIVLYLHGHEERDAQITDFARIDYLLANRRFLLHETPHADADHRGFKENVPTCDYDDFVDTCRLFLDSPKERHQWTERADIWYRENYHLDNFIPAEKLRKWVNSTGSNGRN